MPVTARLSKNFYDRFGDDAANELVEWFNAVDATYRADLRELNDTNFVRFDAGLDRRAAEIDAAMERRFAAMDTALERRFAASDTALEQRFAAFETALERRFAAIDRRFIVLESLIRQQASDFETRLSQFEARMMRWMLTFWVGTLGGLAALVWAMVRAR